MHDIMEFNSNYEMMQILPQIHQEGEKEEMEEEKKPMKIIF